MEIADFAAWVATRVATSVSEAEHHWGLTTAEAYERLEALGDLCKQDYEKIYSLSEWKDGSPFHALSSQHMVPHSAESAFFGLRNRSMSSSSMYSYVLSSALTRIEAAEAEDRLQPFSESGVSPLSQYRRSTYVHRRGPSPNRVIRPNFRSSFPVKRKATPLPTPVKKPKKCHSLTIDHFFK